MCDILCELFNNPICIFSPNLHVLIAIIICTPGASRSFGCGLHCSERGIVPIRSESTRDGKIGPEKGGSVPLGHAAVRTEPRSPGSYVKASDPALHGRRCCLASNSLPPKVRGIQPKCVSSPSLLMSPPLLQATTSALYSAFKGAEYGQRWAPKM